MTRAFRLERDEDESGVSGTGIVAHGVQFADGQCVLWWPNHHSIAVYPSVSALVAIHGHNGKTRLEFES